MSEHARKRKAIRGSVFGALAFLLAACGDRISVQTEHDSTASFGKYRSYILDAAPPQMGPWAKQALEETLRSSLAARGLKETSAGDADLFVVSTVFTKEKLAALSKGGVTSLCSPITVRIVGAVSGRRPILEATSRALWWLISSTATPARSCFVVPEREKRASTRKMPPAFKRPSPE